MCINEEQLSDILILFQVHFLNNFKTQLDARIQSKWDAAKQRSRVSGSGPEGVWKQHSYESMMVTD